MGEALDKMRHAYQLNNDSINKLYRWKRDALDSVLSEEERENASQAFNNALNTPISIVFEDLVNSNTRSVLQTLFRIGVNPQGCDRDKQKIRGDRDQPYDWWDEDTFTIAEPNGGNSFFSEMNL